jgi:hypothetical protein
MTSPSSIETEEVSIMDYSAINHVIYTIGLKMEMFVIGGPFAAGLTEPRLAMSMGSGGAVVELFVSSSNFEVLKDYKPKSTLGTLEVEENKIIYRERYMKITFHRGLPVSWTNKSGFQVQDPVPLKHWLNTNGYESWAALMHDKPFEKRMEGWELTFAEEAFKAACEANDWHTGYSDDYSVQRRGDAAYAALVKMRDELGGNAKAIFDWYSNQ